MAKSPLKEARLAMDLSRSELASLVYPSRDDAKDKAELAQAIARCEAGLLDPNRDGALRLLFERLGKSKRYKTLLNEQESWRLELDFLAP